MQKMNFRGYPILHPLIENTVVTLYKFMLQMQLMKFKENMLHMGKKCVCERFCMKYMRAYMWVCCVRGVTSSLRYKIK